MIRFIVKHTSYDGNPAGDFVVRYQTLDADVPALQAVLLSGSDGMGAFERAELVGVEIVRASDQPSEVQCIRPERSEVNAPAVGSHVTSPEARGDGSGDRRDGGPDAPRPCSCSPHDGPAKWCPKCGGFQECYGCSGPNACARIGCATHTTGTGE